METTFIGTKESAYEFTDRVYSKIESMVLLGTLTLGQVNTSYLRQAEIAAACMDRPFMRKFTKNNFLALPNVSFTLDLNTSIETLIKRMTRRRRRDIKKLQTYPYSFSISRNDEKEFNFFYREMYLPYTLRRFGKTAHVKSYSESKALYRGNGGILFLKRNETPVAGILFQIRGRELYASSFGVYRGDEGLIQNLASQATLFFLIKWAMKKGLKKLDYGASSPFFNDGVFTFKREWGMIVEAQKSQPVYVLKFNSPSQGLLSFLLNNPFIVVDKGKLRGVVFVDHKLTEDEHRKIFSKYFLPRLDSLIIIAIYKSSKLEKSEELLVMPRKMMRPLLEVCKVFQRGNFCVQVSELAE